MIKRGVTFLEILMVIGIMAIVAAFFAPTNQQTVTLEKLTSEAKLVAQRLIQLSIDARVSGHVVQVSCLNNGITARVYLGAQARDYATAQLRAGVSANLLDTYEIERASNLITHAGICASSQTFYITTEGYFFSAQGVPGIANLELRSGSYAATVDVSGAGSTTVKVGLLGAIINEI